MKLKQYFLFRGISFFESSILGSFLNERGGIKLVKKLKLNTSRLKKNYNKHRIERIFIEKAFAATMKLNLR